MFDVGFWELLVIGVIALVVVGPERLPGLMRTVGLWVGRARAAFYSVRDEVEREVNAQGLRETERAVRRDMEKTIHDTRSQVESGLREDGERAGSGSSAPKGEGSKPAGGDQDAGDGRSVEREESKAQDGGGRT